MTPNQFKNLLVFLCLATNEGVEAILDKTPDYLAEKFSRYAGIGTLRDDDAWRWGLHPELRKYFDAYVKIWNLDDAWQDWMEKAGSR